MKRYSYDEGNHYKSIFVEKQIKFMKMMIIEEKFLAKIKRFLRLFRRKNV